jgi:acetylglutamate kinase
MSGKTKSLLDVEPMIRKGKSLGRVGNITGVNPVPVLEAIREGKIPVISPISGDASGNSYNVNADSAAAEIAISTECTDLVYLTDVPGIRAGDEMLASLNVNRAKDLIAQNIIRNGMVAKLESIFRVLESKVHRVIITMWQGDSTIEDIIENRLNQGTVIQ